MQERQHVSRFSINCSDSVSSLAPPCQSHLLLPILLHLLLVQLASLQEYKVACSDGGPAANRCAYDCSILSSGHSRYCFTRFGTRVPKTVNKYMLHLLEAVASSPVVNNLSSREGHGRTPVNRRRKWYRFHCTQSRFASLTSRARKSGTQTQSVYSWIRLESIYTARNEVRSDLLLRVFH